MAERPFDVAVVGAGIIGASVAYHLSKAGARVCVVERRRVGMEASNAAAGMLAPLGEAHCRDAFLDLGMASLRMHSRLAEDLRAETGIDVEYRQTGILRVAFDAGQAEALAQREAWQRGCGLDLQMLDGAMARELEPRLSRRVVAALLSPQEGQVNNQNLTLALIRAAEKWGARVVESTRVTSLQAEDGRVVALRHARGTVNAGHFVLAAGAWTREVARQVAAVPVRPVRGQMMALGGMSAPIRTVVWSANGYLVPRANGLVFAGATVEEAGFRARTTLRGQRSVRAAANEMVPQLSAAAVRFSWAGLRPGSRDGLPILGPLGEFENVTLATGHFRNGILLAPITGKLVAESVLGGHSDGLLAPFAPGRFSSVGSGLGTGQ